MTCSPPPRWTRDQLRKKAQRLREQGKSYPEIAQALGVALKTVRRWLNPDEAQRDREASVRWKHAHKAELAEYDAEYRADPSTRTTCSECGGPTQYSKGLQRKAAEPVCAACIDRRLEERDKELERLWLGGAKFPEIMAHFGWSKGHAATEIFNARARGAHLPYRHDYGDRHARPELRKAA